jgi:hypothetical protein
MQEQVYETFAICLLSNVIMLMCLIGGKIIYRYMEEIYWSIHRIFMKIMLALDNIDLIGNTILKINGEFKKLNDGSNNRFFFKECAKPLIDILPQLAILLTSFWAAPKVSAAPSFIDGGHAGLKVKQMIDEIDENVKNMELREKMGKINNNGVKNVRFCDIRNLHDPNLQFSEMATLADLNNQNVRENKQKNMDLNFNKSVIETVLPIVLNEFFAKNVTDNNQNIGVNNPKNTDFNKSVIETVLPLVLNEFFAKNVTDNNLNFAGKTKSTELNEQNVENRTTFQWNDNNCVVPETTTAPERYSCNCCGQETTVVPGCDIRNEDREPFTTAIPTAIPTIPTTTISKRMIYSLPRKSGQDTSSSSTSELCETEEISSVDFIKPETSQSDFIIEDCVENESNGSMNRSGKYSDEY